MRQAEHVSVRLFAFKKSHSDRFLLVNMLLLKFLRVKSTQEQILLRHHLDGGSNLVEKIHGHGTRLIGSRSVHISADQVRTAIE